MFMNSLRILQERRLAARTVMNRLEVQRREEEEAQINRDLAYERVRIKWVESIWNQVEEKKAKAMRRSGKEETRRNVQSELFHVQWKKESDKWRSQWDLWMLQLGGVPGHPNRIGACSDVQWETLHNFVEKVARYRR